MRFALFFLGLNYFQKQFRDLDVRQHHRRLIDQLLRCFWNCRVKWRYLKACNSDAGIG